MCGDADTVAGDANTVSRDVDTLENDINTVQGDISQLDFGQLQNDEAGVPDYLPSGTPTNANGVRRGTATSSAT